MSKLSRTLQSTFLGALFCAVLTAVVFAAGVLLDGGRMAEAVGFGLAVGVAGGLVGALIGLVVGLFNLGLMGGALVGLLAVAGVIAFYVLAVGRPGQALYFLRESGVILLVLAVPALVAGALAAWFTNRRGTKADD